MTLGAKGGATVVAGADFGRIKGAAFRELLAWYGAREPGASEKLLARLPADVRALLDPSRPALGILASEWYPAVAVHAVLDGISSGLSPADRTRLADEASAAIMNATLRGLYRTLFQWMATPERYARFGPKLWSAYYDSGNFQIQMANPSTAVCTVEGWRGHHPFACDLNRGAARAIYSAMGCRDVRVERPFCVSDGAPLCRFVSTWRERA